MVNVKVASAATVLASTLSVLELRAPLRFPFGALQVRTVPRLAGGPSLLLEHSGADAYHDERPNPPRDAREMDRRGLRDEKH
jgi:hypothetical protein